MKWPYDDPLADTVMRWFVLFAIAVGIVLAMLIF